MSTRLKLPTVLLDLARKSQSGVVRIQKSSAKKQLILDKGAIAFSESNLHEEHLAQIMVSLGFFKNTNIREIISLMKTGKNSEEAVAAINPSKREAVNNAVREQIIVVLSTLLGWDDCEIRFFSGENLIKNRTNMKMNIPEALVVSARRAATKHLIKLPEGFLQGTIVANIPVSGEKTEYPLNEAESYVYTRSYDSISAQELIPLLPASDAAPEEVLQCLYVLGLIDKQIAGVTPDSNWIRSDESDNYLTMIEDMLARFENADFYEILSIAPDASPDQIQAAYHALAKQYHPDRFQSGQFSKNLQTQVEQVFSYINKAYTTLRDPSLRIRYSQERREKEEKTQSKKKAGLSADTTEDEAIEALFQRGRKSLLQGEFEKAAKELKSCAYLRPENYQYNYFLGLAESEISGLYKSAEQHFLKALESEPMSIDSRIALVKLYLKVHLRRKATMVLDEIMRWYPDNPEAIKLRDAIKK